MVGLLWIAAVLSMHPVKRGIQFEVQKSFCYQYFANTGWRLAQCCTVVVTFPLLNCFLRKVGLLNQLQMGRFVSTNCVHECVIHLHEILRGRNFLEFSVYYKTHFKAFITYWWYWKNPSILSVFLYNWK